MYTPKIASASAAVCCFFGARFGGVAEPQAPMTEPSVLIRNSGVVSSSPSTGDRPNVVLKTAFSDKMRMVFLVGLEGSGHHTVNDVLHMLCESENVECPDVCSLAEVLYKELGSFSSASEYKNGLERLRSMMADLAQTEDRLRKQGSVISVATFSNCERRVGEMSFPNYGGEDKPLQYVDLRRLAEEAERAGVDLRLIYLSRPASEILISTTEHRHFGR